MVDLPLPSPSGFQPRIGVRGVLLIAGMTMALRRPHKRMKIAGVSGILGWEEAPVLWGSPSPQSSPRGRGSCLPTALLDSGPVSGYGAGLRLPE